MQDVNTAQTPLPLTQQGRLLTRLGSHGKLCEFVHWAESLISSGILSKRGAVMRTGLEAS